MEMNKSEKQFSEEKKILLKKSAEKLKTALLNSKNPLAVEFLRGELGEIIEQVLIDCPILPFDEIPHFEKMTRDYFTDIEEEYFDFYSLAKYGKSAYKNKL